MTLIVSSPSIIFWHQRNGDIDDKKGRLTGHSTDSSAMPTDMDRDADTLPDSITERSTRIRMRSLICMSTFLKISALLAIIIASSSNTGMAQDNVTYNEDGTKTVRLNIRHNRLMRPHSVFETEAGHAVEEYNCYSWNVVVETIPASEDKAEEFVRVKSPHWSEEKALQIAETLNTPGTLPSRSKRLRCVRGEGLQFIFFQAGATPFLQFFAFDLSGDRLLPPEE